MEARVATGRDVALGFRFQHSRSWRVPEVINQKKEKQIRNSGNNKGVNNNVPKLQCVIGDNKNYMWPLASKVKNFFLPRVQQK